MKHSSMKRTHIMDETPRVLLVPACETGQGGGHIKRCLFILDALEKQNIETSIWIPEEYKDKAFARFKSIFEHAKHTSTSHLHGFYGRLLSAQEDITSRTWDFIIIDRFKTPPPEFAFWYNVAPVIGIDEGGSCRKHFDFLIDLLPALSTLGRPKANITAPALLPLPKKRRPAQAPVSKQLTILISFGAEDSAGLGFLTALNFAKNKSKHNVTLIAPNWNYADKKHRQLEGVNVVGAISNLKEHLAEYDLLITHFGLTAFEAVYARLPVLLLSPSKYHEKLSRNAGFFLLGSGKKALARLKYSSFNTDSIKALFLRTEKIARRFGLEGDQHNDMGAFVSGIVPKVFRTCPVCREPIQATTNNTLERFRERTYRRCNSCGVIYLYRLTPPPIEYEKDYFFDLYKKQYGKTYLEDFPNLKEAARKRLAHITALRTVPKNNAELIDNLKPRLLDIGCAYGPMLAAASELGFSPFGVDAAEDAVRYVNDELNFPAWQGLFPSGAKNEDGPFDVVTLMFVLEHFPEPEKQLREIHRILRDGGVLAFSTPSFAGISARKNMRVFLKKSPQDHWTIWSPRLCKKILARYGFKLCKIVVTGHHPERFPILGKLVQSGKKCLIYTLLLFISRMFRLGDTFEAYAIKV